MNIKKNLYFLIFFLFTPLAAYQYDLAVCAMFQNEGRFLKEWLEFNILIGVEHFYLYNNYSTDNYAEILKPYIEAGIVDCIDWNYSNEGAIGQVLAYNHCLDNTRNKVKWLMIIDLDEFLFPVQCDNLRQFLKDYEKFGAVCAHWVMFGTSNIETIPKNQLSIEALTMREYMENHKKIFIKSIVQPNKIKKFHVHHTEQFYDNYFQVTPDKVRFEGPFMNSNTINKLRINHYWTRDNQYLHEIKIPRRYAFDKSSQEWVLQAAETMNKKKDLTIHKYLKSLKKTVFN